MNKNYKILTSFIKKISSEIPNVESFLHLKDNIPKYSLNIDIMTLPLKNNMAEVDIKLMFNSKEREKNKAYFEMIHATIVRVENITNDKNELKKVFLKEVPTEVYPKIEKTLFEILQSSGYPQIKLEKKINFEELFEKKLV